MGYRQTPFNDQWLLISHESSRFNSLSHIWYSSRVKESIERQYATSLDGFNSVADYSFTEPFSYSHTGAPNPSGIVWGDDDVYWEFDVNWTVSGGLKLSNLKLRNTMEQGSSENVFESIEFPVVKIVFDDGHEEDFDLHGTLVFAHYSTLTITGENEPRVQHGFRVRGDNFFVKDGKTIQVTATFSVALFGPGTDFDPGATQHVMKVFPQVGLEWEKLDGVVNDPQYVIKNLSGTGSFKVKQFKAAVKMVVNLNHQHMMDIRNYASFFTDSNETFDVFTDRYREFQADLIGDLGTYMSALLSSIAGAQAAAAATYIGAQTTEWMVERTLPAWYNLFDYLLPAITNEMKVKTVDTYGNSNSRAAEYKWPQGQPSDDYDLDLKKQRRQMAFDNVHVHGYMGESAFGDTAIHAPFCGMACLHLHWRWSLLANVTGMAEYLDFDTFSGWGEWALSQEAVVFTSPNSHETIGAPLIPPNQELELAIANKTTTYANLATASAALDSDVKAIWYVATANDPNATELQVFMEHGCGYAFKYHNNISAKIVAVYLYFLKEKYGQVPGVESIKTEIDNFYGSSITDAANKIIGLSDPDVAFVYMKMYDLIRYYWDAPYTGEQQVPNGNYDTLEDGTTGTKMKDL